MPSMRPHAFVVVTLGVAQVIACGSRDKATGPGSSATSAAAPVPDPAPATASARATASASATASAKPRAPAAARTYRAYQGTLGKTDIRLALEIAGDHVEGMITRSGGEGALVGEMKDATRFVVREVAPKGRKGATFEGALDGDRLTGTWKDPGAKRPRPVTAGPLRPFTAAESSFEGSYLGSLGARIRIRMKLTKAGGKLTGRYRYMKSKDDLQIAGVVSEADGAMRLEESTSAGKVTGRFTGVFLDKQFAYGRWSSPDGSRTFPFTLRRGDVYPETVPLPGGARIAPQEKHLDKGPDCTASLFYPEVVGGGAGARALNPALEAAAGSAKLECPQGADDFRYESDTTYHVDATRPDRFALSFTFYEYAGGAHGHASLSCFVADVDKGVLTPSRGKILSAEGRTKLAALVNAELKKAHGVERLTEAGFSADALVISDDTALCIEGTSLVVQYQQYEVAPYVMGTPSAEIRKSEAAPLVAGTALEPFFK